MFFCACFRIYCIFKALEPSAVSTHQSFVSEFLSISNYFVCFRILRLHVLCFFVFQIRWSKFRGGLWYTVMKVNLQI